jgi:two-component sensor histidine kinase
VLAMALHELAVNSVAHGSLGGLSGRLEVSWVLADANGTPELTLTWKEAGLSDVTAPAHQGFGTEVLTRTLAYELKAETTLAFEEDGLRCTIRFPLPERIGRVVAD